MFQTPFLSQMPLWHAAFLASGTLGILLYLPLLRSAGSTRKPLPPRSRC